MWANVCHSKTISTRCGEEHPAQAYVGKCTDKGHRDYGSRAWWPETSPWITALNQVYKSCLFRFYQQDDHPSFKTNFTPHSSMTTIHCHEMCSLLFLMLRTPTQLILPERVFVRSPSTYLALRGHSTELHVKGEGLIDKVTFSLFSQFANTIPNTLHCLMDNNDYAVYLNADFVPLKLTSFSNIQISSPFVHCARSAKHLRPHIHKCILTASGDSLLGSYLTRQWLMKNTCKLWAF